MSSEYIDDEQVKETFANFGLAYYAANVFEAGLATAILQLELLDRVKIKSKQQGGRDITRAEYEEEFDKLLAHQHAQSLGNLIKKIHRFEGLSADVKAIIPQVKQRRDFLAHHFFRERAIDFVSRRGRDKMIAELKKDHELFQEADRLMDICMNPVYEKYGLTEHMVRVAQAKMLDEAQKVDLD